MSKKRYYCPQYCDGRAGWTDLPQGAFLSKKPAEDFAEKFAKSHMVSTRTIQKPKGWNPPIEFPPPVIEREFGVGDQARASRKEKRS